MRKKTLVLGASLKTYRYSNLAIRKLKEKNHEVVALGLRKGEVENIKIEIGEPYIDEVNTVTLYINPKRQTPLFEYIISLKPKRVIFNPGTENSDFVKLLEKSKIETVTACTIVLLATDQY